MPWWLRSMLLLIPSPSPPRRRRSGRIARMVGMLVVLSSSSTSTALPLIATSRGHRANTISSISTMMMMPTGTATTTHYPLSGVPRTTEGGTPLRSKKERTTLVSPSLSSSSSSSGSVSLSASSRQDFVCKLIASMTLSVATFATAGVTAPPSCSAAAAATTDIATTIEIGGSSIIYGDATIMSQKGHGTSIQSVQPDLLYGVNNKLADKICNYNRYFAELGGYAFQSSLTFEQTVMTEAATTHTKHPIIFYDSVTGKPLFVAARHRTVEQFITESKVHGWPSFRDDEVVWDNVRVLQNSGETVSVDGTHLGHNLPDRSGNRYCINLVSIAGHPPTV